MCSLVWVLFTHQTDYGQMTTMRRVLLRRAAVGRFGASDAGRGQLLRALIFMRCRVASFEGTGRERRHKNAFARILRR